MYSYLTHILSLWPTFAVIVILMLAAAGCASLKARESEASYPATGRFTRAGGYSLHYIEAGSGSPVIYVHGSQGSTIDLTLSPTFAALTAEFHVITYDRPGFGHTRRDDREHLTIREQAAILQQFIEKRALTEKPIIVGHSLGGSIALQHAADFPGAARGYVVLSTVAYGWGGGATLLETLATVPVVGELFVQSLILPLGPGVARRSLAEAFNPIETPDDFARITTAFALRPSQYRATAMDMPSLSTALDALSPRYPTITAPLTIIHGGMDTICPATYHATRLHAAVPGSVLVLLPEAPHELQFTSAATIRDAVRHLADSSREHQSSQPPAKLPAG